MTASEQKKAAKAFAEYWEAQPGSEIGEYHKFWESLLGEVFGVGNLKDYIKFQEKVYFNDGTTKRLDAWIPETAVLIEHKSRGVNLDAPQAGHHGQTPFEQAWDYDNNRPRRERARWIVVSNFDEIRVHDMEADRPAIEYQTILLKDIAKETHRLSFLVSQVESVRDKEARVSVEAGRVVGKLYAAFLEECGDLAKDPKFLRDLNILCVRLVFCVYAEDAGVFGKDQFLIFLRQFKPASFHLQLRELFKVLSQRENERSPMLPDDLKAFPFVGGGLFRDEVDIPVFSDKVADILLNEASEHFDWSEISPTIFGAVFESTLNPETRRKGGMHYTSEENIHKVIDPLFLDNLKAEFAAVKAKPAGKARDRELEAFQDRLGNLRFLDPACGSGNFLTETYLSLRKLENEALETRFRGQGQFDLDDRKLIRVSINQFYGIEINDFAVTVAQTAMWIAECKMMEETNRILSKNFTPLPLTDSAKVVEGNALKMDWEKLLTTDCTDYTDGRARTPSAPHFDYIMGNPPFIGARNKSPEQAADVESVFPGWKGVGNLDYVTCWYKKAADIMVGGDLRTPRTQCAFVSTNSICQGDGVSILWKPLFEMGVEIDYAWTTFVWDSEATDKAHVHVVIIGFSVGGDLRAPRGAPGGRALPKRLFGSDGKAVEAKHINGYLMDGPDVWIANRTDPLCGIPPTNYGSFALDDGNFTISEQEYAELKQKEPNIDTYLRPFIGAQEFLHNKKRYCVWLRGMSPALIKQSRTILEKVERVRLWRSSSSRKNTVLLANTPTLFAEVRQPQETYIAIPTVCSERREYIPLGFLSPQIVASNQLYIVPATGLFHFGVLTSSVHMAWMRVVAGRLKSDYRYSAAIVYNNFPWPGGAPGGRPLPSRNVSEASDESEFVSMIEKTAQGILDARALYPDSSLADLYDPLTMPAELRKAHQANDAAVMKAYGFPPDLTESEIVSRLFEMYAKLTAESPVSE